MDETESWLERARIKKKADSLERSVVNQVERKTYDEMVLQLYNDYEQTVFNLSEQSKNETIESIKNMSVGQRHQFMKLISEKNRRLKSSKNG